MRKKQLSYELLTRKQEYEYLKSIAPQERSEMYEQRLKVLRNILEDGLTDRQRQCVEMYYFENLNMRKIGLKLGIHETTVGRHLKYARRNIEKLMKISATMEHR